MARRPGVLMQALSPPSSYAAKGGREGGGTVWADLKDRVDGALYEGQLDEFVAWLNARPLNYPAAYREPLDELIEAKREELRAESIGQILLDKYDF